MLRVPTLPADFTPARTWLGFEDDMEFDVLVEDLADVLEEVDDLVDFTDFED